MIEHISPSSLGLFCRCREAFRRRYICGDVIPPGIAACVGSGFHKACEKNHKQKIETGTDLSVEELQEIARDSYDRAIRNGVMLSEEEKQESAKALGAGADNAVNLAAAYAEKVAPTIHPALVEKQLIAEVPGLEVPFLGIIDVYEFDATCRDMKSAARKWAAGKAETEMQPPIYNYLLKENGMQTGKFAFDVLTYKQDHQHIELTPQMGDMVPIIARSKSLISAVMSGDFPPAEPGHWMCNPKWCGYWYTCPHIPARLK